ncbi:hypothetical protein [Corallococcus sp. RDP092CA]|uniref:hypothetical protein n=1 Tax=Corallococcus sp. RDP092CA TaxID=3109369 RepID=UPI0035AF9C38
MREENTLAAPAGAQVLEELVGRVSIAKENRPPASQESAPLDMTMRHAHLLPETKELDAPASQHRAALA